MNRNMTDSKLLAAISSTRFEQPADICRRVGMLSVNGMLGRLHRMGMLERVPTKKNYLYRSRQLGLK